MRFKIPKNNEKYHWTLHSIEKMRYYGLSEQKILNVIKRPKRKEEGIVKNTIAVMQPVSPKPDKEGKAVWKQEIWTMYQIKKGRKKRDLSELEKLLQRDQIKIISAWRYPGISPENNPIPEDILRELAEGGLE